MLTTSHVRAMNMAMNVRLAAKRVLPQNFLEATCRLSVVSTGRLVQPFGGNMAAVGQVSKPNQWSMQQQYQWAAIFVVLVVVNGKH